VLNFKAPFYLGATLGEQLLWPEPQHLLGDAYAKYLQDKNPDDVANLSYWSSNYVNVGPFKLTSYDVSSGYTFQAYDGYFLGRPKIDTIQMKIFGDSSALYAGLLAGTADVFTATAISQEQAYQLRNQWASSGQGQVVFGNGNMWFLSPQSHPQFQTEVANFDPRVRAALYTAIDRVSLTSLLLDGQVSQVADSILPPKEPLYDVTKDDMRPFAFDPTRAKALLADAGWTPGGDGLLHNSADGR